MEQLVLPEGIIKKFPKATATSEYREEYSGYLITVKNGSKETALILRDLQELEEPKVMLAIELSIKNAR